MGLRLAKWGSGGVGAIATSLALTAPIRATTAPGDWGPWRPHTEIPAADFAAGFSNLELGGFMDFQHACADRLSTTADAVPYQFRLSRWVDQIGTGPVEYGCWQGDRLLFSFTSTAIQRQRENVTCWQVVRPTGLVVYAEPERRSPWVRILPPQAQMQPSSYPALSVTRDGITWLQITGPMAGWVRRGATVARSSVQICPAATL